MIVYPPAVGVFQLPELSHSLVLSVVPKNVCRQSLVGSGGQMKNVFPQYRGPCVYPLNALLVKYLYPLVSKLVRLSRPAKAASATAEVDESRLRSRETRSHR